MPVMSLFLNLLWIVFGGLWMAVGWVFAAVIMAITIIGLPWMSASGLPGNRVEAMREGMTMMGVTAECVPRWNGCGWQGPQ